jgi:hypothetical protein
MRVLRVTAHELDTGDEPVGQAARHRLADLGTHRDCTGEQLPCL